MSPRRIRPGEGWELALGELLTYLGWEWQHTRAAFVPGRRAPITPMVGPAAPGWPDFTAMRPESHRGPARFLVAEAKEGNATLTAVQRRRLEAIDAGGIVEAYRFRERDLDTIRRVLAYTTRPEELTADTTRALTPWRVRPSRR